ncbi:MAG: type II toxin-antitoxin system prevent-host-death family antitoxin [Acetobacteraceae bacterium]|nr:type II toxin-antitoxin system prevent-host-death family antitoxin [Acetobacteraceae bacterium]
MTLQHDSTPEPPPDDDATLLRDCRKQRRLRSPQGGDSGLRSGKLQLSYRPDIEARKELLRRAAARLLARHSIAAVSMRAVVREAGWHSDLIRYYYRDADELLADTLVEHVLALNAAVCAAFDATLEAPPPERMTALLDAFLRVALGQRNEHRALRLNTKLVSEERRPAVIGRSRQIIATLREALFGCVPGLDAHPEIGGLLVRQLVGALSEATIWFQEDERVDRLGLAQLLASQMLVVAHAAVDGSWVLPAPAPIPPAPPPALQATHGLAPPAEPRPSGASQPAPANAPAIWLSPEQARRSLTRLVRAVQAGTEVVLTHRGVPAAKLVKATQERERLQRTVGGRGG